MRRLMSRRRLRPLAYLAVLAVLWAATQWVDGMAMGWLALAPALLLLFPLLAGRYVGDVALERLARRGCAAVRRRDRATPVLWRILGTTPHGGLVLGRRVAGRAPPLVDLVH
jgi:hypothetical protein